MAPLVSQIHQLDRRTDCPPLHTGLPPFTFGLEPSVGIAGSRGNLCSAIPVPHSVSSQGLERLPAFELLVKNTYDLGERFILSRRMTPEGGTLCQGPFGCEGKS